MVDVYATGDAECLEPVGSDPSIQAGSAIGDRRVGAARLRTHNTSHITHKLAMKYDGRHTGLHPRLATECIHGAIPIAGALSDE